MIKQLTYTQQVPEGTAYDISENLQSITLQGDTEQQR